MAETRHSGFGIDHTLQLDLGLGGRGATTACARSSLRRRQVLMARAKFFFDEMRRVVDSAVEWKPTPPARPEQTALDLRRDTEVAVAK